MASKKSNFYLTREELIQEIILSKKKHRESNHPRTPAECFTPKLTSYLQLMVNRYANKGQWRSYSYLDDMKSDALLTLCQNAFKYNEEKYDNPFGYYTQIIKYSFITFLEREEIIRDIKDSLWESIGMTPSYARQLKNEMLRDVVDQSSKGMKTLKKDVEILTSKIDGLSTIISQLNRDANPNTELDCAIADVLENAPLPYTGDITAVLVLFITPPHFVIDRDIEIDGKTVNCLSIYDDSTKSNTKRVLKDTDEMTIVVALCSIALSIRRDLLVKHLREITGYNLSNTNMPTAEKITQPSELDEPFIDYTPTPKRKGRKRNVD